MLLRLWDFPGKNAGVGCHFLLQEIFPTQGLNPGIPQVPYACLALWLVTSWLIEVNVENMVSVDKVSQLLP